MTVPLWGLGNGRQFWHLRIVDEVRDVNPHTAQFCECECFAERLQREVAAIGRNEEFR